MSSSATPSYVQSVASSFALLSLSIWLAPFTFGLTVAAWVFAGLYARVTGFLGGSEDVEQPDKSPVVLINGAKVGEPASSYFPLKMSSVLPGADVQIPRPRSCFRKSRMYRHSR